MKWLLPILLLMTSPLMAQQKAGSGTLNDAVRAFHGGDYEAASALFETVLASDPKNQAAQKYMRMIQAQQKNASSLPATLKKVNLPKVEFQEASPKEAFDYIAQQVQKQTAGKQSVNIVWMVPEGQEKKVTLSLQNIPAFEALRYIADAADLQLEYDNFAVKIRPAAASN
jgi:alkyl sulfatase BDS1-like metallo-beta-lactamase superfamily hydrolase